MGEQITRGDLPHWYRPGHAHFVTYRLAGCLPAAQLRELRQEREKRLKTPPRGMDRAEHRSRVNRLMFGKYDRLLDEVSAIRWLTDERIAAIVRDNLYYHRHAKYELIAYCIMPNHVHVVLQPFESNATTRAQDANDLETPDNVGVLSGIMHSLKSYTANRANQVLERDGPFWQRESYDHWVRDIDELERIVTYVAANPVRAGLCRQPQDWQFSSAYDRFAQDGSRCALVGWLRDDWKLPANVPDAASVVGQFTPTLAASATSTRAGS